MFVSNPRRPFSPSFLNGDGNHVVSMEIVPDIKEIEQLQYMKRKAEEEAKP